MTARASHLIREGLKLSPEERMDVVAELLASLDDAGDERDAEWAWATEIERRARRVLDGASSGTPWAEARAQIVERALKR